MTVYITGDVHAEVERRFGFKNHPELKELTSNDIVVVLGDWGVPWNHTTAAQDYYKAKFIDSKPWTTIALRGNHDNTNLMREMPQENKFGGSVRRLAVANDKGEVYTCDHVYIVDDPTVLTLGEDKCLCIPGGDSHDMDYDAGNPYGRAIIDKTWPYWKKLQKRYKFNHTFYRTLGESWWADESVDIDKCAALLEKEGSNFDLILSHDFPGCINAHYKRPYDIGRRQSTERQNYLEFRRKTLNFDVWFHGHLHVDMLPSSSVSSS